MTSPYAGRIRSAPPLQARQLTDLHRLGATPPRQRRWSLGATSPGRATVGSKSTLGALSRSGSMTMAGFPRTANLPFGFLEIRLDQLIKWQWNLGSTLRRI